jgi:hypothetical protein
MNFQALFSTLLSMPTLYPLLFSYHPPPFTLHFTSQRSALMLKGLLSHRRDSSFGRLARAPMGGVMAQRPNPACVDPGHSALLWFWRLYPFVASLSSFQVYSLLFFCFPFHPFLTSNFGKKRGKRRAKPLWERNFLPILIS